jgi:hypothetical protein
LDLNGTDTAKALHEIIRTIAQNEFDNLKANLKFEAVGKVVANSSGAMVSVYINGAPTAVMVKNPRSFSLTTGELVGITYPNFNENLKYIDRLYT